MQNETNLFNLALEAAGTRKTVSSPQEKSAEGERLRLWYPVVRRKVLRAAHWNSAKKVFRLNILAERTTSAVWVSTDPDPGFLFAYSLPEDCLMARYLTDFQSFKLSTYRAENAHTKAIMSNAEDAILVYTLDETNVALWDAGLYHSIIYALAASICQPTTGKGTRSTNLYTMSNELILAHRVDAANEDSGINEYIPDYIQARGFSSADTRNHYLQPYGSLLGSAGGPLA